MSLFGLDPLGIVWAAIFLLLFWRSERLRQRLWFVWIAYLLIDEVMKDRPKFAVFAFAMLVFQTIIVMRENDRR